MAGCPLLCLDAALSRSEPNTVRAWSPTFLPARRSAALPHYMASCLRSVSSTFSLARDRVDMAFPVCPRDVDKVWEAAVGQLPVYRPAVPASRRHAAFWDPPAAPLERRLPPLLPGALMAACVWGCCAPPPYPGVSWTLPGLPERALTLPPSPALAGTAICCCVCYVILSLVPFGISPLSLSMTYTRLDSSSPSAPPPYRGPPA